MFGGNDPFMRMFRDMHETMGEMDRMMMGPMMDPFGMLGMRGHPMGMIQGPPGIPPPPGSRLMSRPPHPFQAFAFPDIFGHMNSLCDMAVNDPNSVMFSQSTMISMDGSGQPKIVEHSTRKSGDVREIRRRFRDGAEEEMEIGHSIGDRAHVLEKKRDKDGNVRKNQRFVNLDQVEAESFDREFRRRAERNLGDWGYGSRRRDDAIEARSSPYTRRGGEPWNGIHSSGAPIVTLPDEDEDSSERRGGGNARASSPSRGPIIREISEEEAEQSIPKRRKDMAGRYFRANDI